MKIRDQIIKANQHPKVQENRRKLKAFRYLVKHNDYYFTEFKTLNKCTMQVILYDDLDVIPAEISKVELSALYCY